MTTSKSACLDGQHCSIVDIIKKDHGIISNLYETFSKTTDLSEKLKFGQELIRAICVHSSAEEMVLYPLLDTEISNEMGDHSREEHREVEKLIHELDGASNIDEKYVQTVDRAMQLLKQHVKEEEQEILPKLASKHTSDDLENLGNNFQASKAMAPTHPHPLAPKSGITGMAAKVISKPLDELKDTVAGVKSTAVEPQLQK